MPADTAKEYGLSVWYLSLGGRGGVCGIAPYMVGVVCVVSYPFFVILFYMGTRLARGYYFWDPLSQRLLFRGPTESLQTHKHTYS